MKTQTYMDINDSNLFVHDQSNIDLVDTLPPVSYITNQADWLTGEKRSIRASWSDEDYQAMADTRSEELDSIERFGEGWIGMGNHTIEMTGLERMIFEDCYDGSGGVQRPGLNIPTISKYQRAEWIAFRLQKIWPEADMADAEVMITAWRSLEAKPDMVEKFISGFGKKSLDQTIEYFVNLASELDQVTYQFEDIETEPLETTYARWAGRHGHDPEDDSDDLEPNADRFASSEVFRYTQISNDLGEDHWMEHQRPWFKRLIIGVKKIDNYCELKRLGSGIKAKQDQGRLTKDQAMVFWSAYKSRKAKLQRRIKHINPHVPELMDRILAAPDSKVGYIGFWLFDQSSQAGRETGAWAHAKSISKAGWSLLKEAYFSRKNDLLAAQAGLLK